MCALNNNSCWIKAVSYAPRTRRSPIDLSSPTTAAPTQQRPTSGAQVQYSCRHLHSKRIVLLRCKCLPGTSEGKATKVKYGVTLCTRRPTWVLKMNRCRRRRRLFEREGRSGPQVFALHPSSWVRCEKRQEGGRVSIDAPFRRKLSLDLQGGGGAIIRVVAI